MYFRRWNGFPRAYSYLSEYVVFPYLLLVFHILLIMWSFIVLPGFLASWILLLLIHTSFSSRSMSLTNLRFSSFFHTLRLDWYRLSPDNTLSFWISPWPYMGAIKDICHFDCLDEVKMGKSPDRDFILDLRGIYMQFWLSWWADQNEVSPR